MRGRRRSIDPPLDRRPALAVHARDDAAHLGPETPAADDITRRPIGRAARGLVGRIRLLPIFTKVLVANCAIVFLGALFGTLLTARTVRADPGEGHYELVFIFAAIGAGLSVVVNFAVLKIALRPLDGLTRTVEAVRKGNLRARAARDSFSDPQIENLRQTLNAMLDRLDEHGARLRALSSQIITAQEQERLRIARELHDETAQTLASVLVRQRVAERTQDPDALRRAMADLRALTSDALEGVRRMALELRPTMLDDLGLVAALEAYARQVSQRAGPQIEFEAADGLADGSHRLPPEVELVVYRVVQEALSNVARHSGAARAVVSLVMEHGTLVVTVADDGRGFDPSVALDSRQSERRQPEGRHPDAGQPDDRQRSLGLFGMRERAALVGGRVQIESMPGRGTRVCLEVPFRDGPTDG